MRRTVENEGWYYYAGSDGFGGFEYLDAEDLSLRFVPDDLWGPFLTFEAAKKDAIEYFQCDVRRARLSIRSIRKMKKSDANGIERKKY